MRIAIDLTPLLLGGENGGAKIMTLELIKEMIILSPASQFILLASNKNYAELNHLHAHNVQVINTSPQISVQIFRPFFNLFKTRRQQIEIKTQQLANKIYQWFYCKILARRIKADLLFCPFTAPLFKHLNLPIVSVIYDLQSYFYPFFFTHRENYIRKKNFENACKTATKLICISDYVRQTILDNSTISPDKVKRIYIGTADRLKPFDANLLQTFLNQYELDAQNYLLFPANFWQHKNHQMLFVAFKLFLTAHPHSSLQLVCTGADNDFKVFLQDAIKKMGLEKRIIFLGFLSDEDFSNLIQGAFALIFPSLYEGFGMPIIEAMVSGKPVLCSNQTCLPEIAGSAALFFDPTKPDEIAETIHRITQEPQLAEALIVAGKERATTFGNIRSMTQEYIQTFKQIIET